MDCRFAGCYGGISQKEEGHLYILNGDVFFLEEIIQDSPKRIPEIQRSYTDYRPLRSSELSLLGEHNLRVVICKLSKDKRLAMNYAVASQYHWQTKNSQPLYKSFENGEDNGL